MNWQPIETAPKDGTNVLLWDREYHVIAFYNGADDPKYPWRTPDGAYSLYEDTPTHWMPLPDPPSAKSMPDNPQAIENGYNMHNPK